MINTKRPPALTPDRKISLQRYIPEIMGALLFMTVAWYGVDIYTAKMDQKTRWDDYKSISSNHDLMVDAYLECRSQTFGGTKGECQVSALMYGKSLKIAAADDILMGIVEIER